MKKRADVALSRSNLDWVIVRAAALKDDAATGLVSLGAAEIHTYIDRDDVAAVLAELVHTPLIRQRVLEVRQGSRPVGQAVAALAVV